MADFISGVNEGLSAAHNMIYGDAQARAETSSLSSRAQEQQLSLKEHQQAYSAKMAIYSSEKNFARENNNIDISTFDGIDKMYGGLAKSPEIMNNPEAMIQLLDMKNKNKLSMQQAEKANKDIEVEQLQMTHDATNRALIDPTNTSGWTEAIGSANSPAIKQMLEHGQKFFNSPKYRTLDDDAQLLEQRKFLGHLSSGKEVAQAANGIATTIINSGKAATTASDVQSKIRDRSSKENQGQQRLNIEKNKAQQSADKHAGDIRKNIDTLKKQAADAIDKIEVAQRKILLEANIDTVNTNKSSWFGFVKNSALSTATKAQYQELELQKVRRHINLAEGLRQYDKDPKNSFPNAPDKGTIKNGYKYNGGDPSKQENWSKI